MLYLRRHAAPKGRCNTNRFNWVDVLIVIVALRTCYIGYVRGIGTELVKCTALLSALALGANFHELLAGLVTQLRLPATFWLVPAYLLIVVLVLWIGRMLNQIVIVKLFKRETPGSTVERLLGAVAGVGRGLLAVGAILLVLQISPLNGFADYLSASVYERSASGAKVVEASRFLMERAANLAPGQTNRSELFPFAP